MEVHQKPRTPIMIRRYQPGEEAQLQEIYVESNRRLNSKHYTPAQIERWVAKHANLKEWSKRLSETNPWVAIVDGRPVAFAELESSGHIDLFYCHPDYQGQGAGSKLLRTIISEASRLGLRELGADVSVTAESFFSRRGFGIVEERTAFIEDGPAKQYIMRKRIYNAMLRCALCSS